MASSLASALEYMPLAIIQATSYIVQTAPLFSLRQYLDKLQQSDRKKTNLLDHEGGQLRRDQTAKNSIILAWQISFEHIYDTRPTAANLLSLMSFCNRQGIPKDLLHGLNDQETELPTIQDNSSKHDDARDDMSLGHGSDSTSTSSLDDIMTDIVTLRDYSFVSINEDGTVFEMHSLV